MRNAFFVLQIEENQFHIKKYFWGYLKKNFSVNSKIFFQNLPLNPTDKYISSIRYTPVLNVIIFLVVKGKKKDDTSRHTEQVSQKKEQRSLTSTKRTKLKKNRIVCFSFKTLTTVRKDFPTKSKQILIQIYIVYIFYKQPLKTFIMENVLISILAVLVSVISLLSAMKFVKFVYKKLIKKPIIWLLNFYKPELKNLYDLGKWLIKLFQSKEVEA